MVLTDNVIKEWVDVHTEALYAWALYKLSDEELSKDIIQETFITAYQKLHTFESKSNPKTWLFAILNHKIIDYYRKRFRNPVHTNLNTESDFFDEYGMWQKDKRPKAWENDSHLLDNPDFLTVLHNCMEKLPQNWASAIQLKYLSEKDGHEICKKLNISTTNYWQIIHRAKLNLRQCLELNWFK